MKTVGDFYNAGLEFVMGDECDGSNGQVFSKKWIEYSNENDDDFVDCTPTKFAWRANTGEKPSFSGLIEYRHNDGDVETIDTRKADRYFFMTCPVSGRVTKWRPSLNQSTTQTETSEEKEAFNAMTESKPIFTQAMADAGELPPVGMLVQIKSLNDAKPCFINGTVIHVMHGEVWYRDDKRGNCITFTDKLMFKPIKTEREKAIDEMQEVVCSQGFLSKMDVSFGIAEEIYNANYRKLTPSQAKAYDDKTEYFGEDYK